MFPFYNRKKAYWLPAIFFVGKENEVQQIYFLPESGGNKHVNLHDYNIFRSLIFLNCINGS